MHKAAHSRRQLQILAAAHLDFHLFFSVVIIKAWKDIIIDNKDEIYIIIFRIISWIIICRTAPVFDLRKSVRSGD